MWKALICYLCPILTTLGICPKILQKISSIFTKVLLEVAQLFRAHGGNQADGRYLLCSTIPWAEFEPYKLVLEHPQSAGTQNPNRVQSSWIHCDPLRCYKAWLDHPVRYRYGATGIPTASVSWSGLKATGLDSINLLKPTGYVMHQQFIIQQLYVLPTLYLCVLYLSENKQRLVPLTA